MWQMDLWEIFRGLEENLAKHTNWMIIREFCMNMRNIFHFQSLLACPTAPVPRPEAAAYMSHKCRESRKQWISDTDSTSCFLKPRYIIVMSIWLLFLCLILQQVRGWKVVCEQKPTLFAGDRSLISLSTRTWDGYFTIYIQIILFRDMAHWRAQFFCKSACSADPARACSLCSRVSAHHGTRRQPSSRPFRPSWAARSLLTPELPVTLAWRLSSTSQNFNHGEYNSDRIK